MDKEDKENWLNSLDLTLRWLALSFFLYAVTVFSVGIVSAILSNAPKDVQADSRESDTDFNFVYYYHE